MSDNINVVIKYSTFHELVDSYKELLRSYKYKCSAECPICGGTYGQHNQFCESSEAQLIFRNESILDELINPNIR